MKQRRNPWVRGIAALSALLVFTAAGCGKTEEPASDVSGSESASAESTTGNEMTSSATEDNTMTTTTQDGTTTTADTAGTTTTRPVDTDVPDAAQVGSADFKPGSLYKGPTVGFRESGDTATLGTWWWDLSGIVRPVNGVSVDMILDMLIANNVTEIYLDVGKMIPWSEEKAQGGLSEDDVAAGMVSESQVRGFVKNAISTASEWRH